MSEVIVWQDGRAAEICAGLEPHRTLIADRTGLVLDPYFSAPKQAWLRRHTTAAGVVTTTDSWLLHRLTGEFVTDAATASRSMVAGLDEVAWDAELLALFGLADEALPEIMACDSVVGRTTAFGAAVPVGGLIVDQQAALLAERCLVAGELKCTFGTGAFLVANTGRIAPRSASGLTTSVAWRARGGTAYCLDGQVYTAASAIRWLRDVGLIADVAELDAVAAQDAGGVLSVPAFAGLAAPWWRSSARATLLGMSLSTGRGQLVRAVLEGIAAQVAELCRLVAADLGRPVARLRVDGGLTRSRVLMQAVADLTQLPVEVYPSAHATAFGAVALGRMAIDPDLSLADAVVAWTPGTGYRPAWSADQAAEFSGRWLAAVEAGHAVEAAGARHPGGVLGPTGNSATATG